MLELKNGYSELTTLINKHERCIVDFYTTWCGPCKMLTPELEKLEQLHPEWLVIRIDAEKFPDVFAKTGSTGVPTVLFFKNKQVVDQMIGFRPLPEIEKIIKKY